MHATCAYCRQLSHSIDSGAYRPMEKYSVISSRRVGRRRRHRSSVFGLLRKAAYLLGTMGTQAAK